MPIRFRCSVCHNPLSIARRKVGTAINCARCSAALTVPAASDSSLAALRPRGSQHQTPAIAPAVVSPPTAPQEDAAFSALPSPDPLALPTKPLPAPSDGARRRWAVALAACGLGALLVAGLLLTGSARRQEVVAVQISRVTTPADPLLIAELGDPTRLGTPANNNQLIEPALTEGAKPKVPPVVEQPKEQPPPAVVPPPPVKKFSPRELAEAEAELYRTALKTAQQALIDGQFEQAVTWFQIAGKIRNSDEVVQGLLRAEQGRLEALVRAERERDRLEKERRLAKYGQWMLSGQSARHLRQFDDARTAYTEAQKLFPEDVRAADALTETERERLLWEADLKRKAERKKRQDDLTLEAKAQRDSADYRKAMAFGWSALRDGKFDAALASFGEALSLRPDDEDAKTGRDTAYWSRKRQRLDEQEREEKQWRQQLEARAREEQLRRDKAYKQFLFDGEEALGGRRHDEAVGLFLQALEMRPDDPEVLKLLREAQQAREKIRTEREEQAKVRLEQQALIASAAAKKLERLQQEQATLKQAEKARQRAAEARQFLIDSEVALASGQFDDALKLLDKARGLQPETPTMIALREQASQRKEERVTTLRQLKEVRDAQAKIKEETERRKLKERETLLAAQAAKQAKEFQAMSYERFLKEGKQALDQRAFDFAIAQLNAALRVRPEDAAVVELLDKAGRQREEHLQALAMEKEKHDREVAAAAEEARLRKQERDRLEGERQAQAEANRKARQFDQYLLDGRQSLGKNDPDVALTQLSLAQKLRPDDRDLKNLIEQ
ncbi:MAG TPA: tetratricopeptide repeat protein, partial [Gemmataceae bacterium]|nr:tetratricopeptide repeat protein [Gemmataceae bacterium]